MAARISRAKQRIKAAGSQFRLPAAPSDDGAAARRPARAVPDLQRGLHRLLRARAAPRRPGPRGHPPDPAGCPRCCPATRGGRPARADAADRLPRAAARPAAGGDLIPLDEQDRAAWDARLIDEGTALVSAAMAGPALGPTSSRRPSPRPTPTPRTRRGHRLAPGARALPDPRADRAQPDGHAQPRGRAGPDQRARAGLDLLAALDGDPADGRSPPAARGPGATAECLPPVFRHAFRQDG